MLALNLIRNETDRVRAGLAAKGEPPESLDAVLKLDEQRRAILGELEDLRHQVNELSRQIGPAPDQDARQTLIAESKEASTGIGPLEEKLATTETDLNDLLLGLPNLPHGSVPVGKNAAEQAYQDRRYRRCATKDPYINRRPAELVDDQPALGHCYDLDRAHGCE